MTLLPVLRRLEDSRDKNSQWREKRVEGEQNVGDVFGNYEC
jgi:hypothetical protein